MMLSPTKMFVVLMAYFKTNWRPIVVKFFAKVCNVDVFSFWSVFSWCVWKDIYDSQDQASSFLLKTIKKKKKKSKG